ncbi:MAG: gamma-glutamylcyclotransferase family protein [Patescibacteria group bacterium]
MEKLFTYGSLRSKEVQKKLFGRELVGKPDALHNFSVSLIEISGIKYPIAEPKIGGRISGIVYQLSEDEFRRTDVYEGEKYERTKLKLESGDESWVYICKPNPDSNVVH